MILLKAVEMAEMMRVPIIEMVENMSYFIYPDNSKEYKIFGESHIDKTANMHTLKVIAKIPIDTRISTAGDKGMIDLFDGDWFVYISQLLKMKEKEMTRIAIAGEGRNVTEHFGHCINFIIYDVENGKIIKEESIPNPGHRPGFLPNFLADRGVNVIISGGMGGGAVDIFNQRNVEVVVGASGDAKNAVLNYLKGELKTTGSVCHEHQHHDECGE